MRGTVAKRLRKFAMPLFVEVSQEEKNKEYCQARYMMNQKTKQIRCAGFRGIYRRVKKMFRDNVEVVV